MKKQIKIGRTNYKIFVSHYIDDKYSLGKIRFGGNIRKKNIILIDKEQSKKKQMEVLYHEIVHGLLYELSKSSKKKVTVRGKKINYYEYLTRDEDLVDSLSMLLLKTFTIKNTK